MLHHLVERLVEAEVVGRNSVHRYAAALVEYGRRRRRDPGKLGVAAQKFGNAGATTARIVRINLGPALDQFRRRIGIVVYQKHSTEDQNTSGAGARHVVTALRQWAVVVSRQDQVFPALAAIRAWRAEIDDPTPPIII